MTQRVTKQAYAMVAYYGMSDRLPNLCYYDSTGQDYGFSKPYSDERARLIDEEVSRIISEQYERAKEILRSHAEGHGRLADTLISREVIFTEDVEKIFGKRQWASRTDEILAANQAEATPMDVQTAMPPMKATLMNRRPLRPLRCPLCPRPKPLLAIALRLTPPAIRVVRPIKPMTPATSLRLRSRDFESRPLQLISRSDCH